MQKFVLLCILAIAFVGFTLAQNGNSMMLESSKYNSATPTPSSILGFDIGDRPTRYEETVKYLSILADVASNMQMVEQSETHEGRKLYYLVISSQANFDKHDEIKKDIAKLANPGLLSSKDDALKIIDSSPAVAFMMYSIHGNELSGTDAAIQLAYQLAAGTDERTKTILENLIVIIYPMENPDGRERSNNQIMNWSGEIKNSDTQSFPHSGLWPSARTNHYFFDLNRDWFILSQPETQAKIKVLLDWNPQLVVDAHEMGSFSTFLFNPPREPINPNMHSKIKKWWKVFADDQAAESDKYGWSYYTREWLEEWYPGYGSSWPSYHGAVSILYEQASTSGSLVKRPDGTILTFKDAVQHQFINSLANLNTASQNRKNLLRDFYEIKNEAADKSLRTGIEAVVINRGLNASRINKLAEVLIAQGIDVFTAEKDFTLSKVKNYWSKDESSQKFDSGSLVIPVKQPAQNLIWAILDFDVRMDNKFLESERKSLLEGKGTRLYEVSAWSMPLAYGVDACFSPELPDVKISAYSKVKKSPTIMTLNSTYGYLIDYHDDNSILVLSRLLERGYKVRCASEKFTIEGNAYEKGTLLLRLNENPTLLESDLLEVAFRFNINVIGVNTALSQMGTDLGGGNFTLLTQPKMAMLTGHNISINNFGAAWFLLDREIGLRVSILNAHRISSVDLRKYNVLILPSVYGGKSGLLNMISENGLKKIKEWISDGGTLIAMGGAAAALADTSSKFSDVRLRSQNLDKLDQYERAVSKENFGKIKIDSIQIWEGYFSDPNENGTDDKKVSALLKETDADNIKFMTRGSILRVNLDTDHWLSYGVGEKIPAILYSNNSLLSKSPVQTAGRFSDANSIRLSGLVWPEAKERLQNSAYLTREPHGDGQIILFAGDPIFRAYFHGTAKLFYNAIFLGPGFGSRQALEW